MGVVNWDEVFSKIIRNISGNIGKEYFESLVEFISTELCIEYSLIGVFNKDKDKVDTLAFYGNGKILENITYELRGTPCNDVIKSKPCYFSDNIQNLFPEDKDFVSTNSNSYVGIPLYGSSSSPIGVLCAFGPKILDDKDSKETLAFLNLASTRASLEIERETHNKKIEERENRFKCVIKASDVILFLTDKNGIVLMSEGGGLEAIGSYVGKNIGKSMFDAYKDYPQIIKGVNDALNGKDSRLVEEFNGNFIDVSYSPYKNEKGEIIGCMGLSVDITKEYKVIKEKELLNSKVRESEEKFKSIITSSDLIVFLIDKQGKFLMSQGSGLKNIDSYQNRVVGMSAFEIYESKPEIIDGINLALKGEINKKIVEVKDNIFSTIYSPYRNSEGEIIGCAGVSTNITKEYKATREKELLGSKYKTLVDSANELIFSTDEHGIIETWNKAIEQRTGVSKSIIGKSIFDEKLYPNLSSLFNLVKECLSRKSSSVNDIRIKDLNNNGLSLISNISLIKEDNSINGIVCISKEDNAYTDFSEDFSEGYSYALINETREKVIKILDGLDRKNYDFNQVGRSVDKKHEKSQNLINPEELFTESFILNIKSNKQIFYFCQLEYIILKYGFEKFMKFIYDFNDYIIDKNIIGVFDIEYDVLSKREQVILTNELKRVKLKDIDILLKQGEVDLLNFLKNKNEFNIKTSFKDISSKFGLAKKTTKNLIEGLQLKGFVSVEKEGRNKLISITTLGKTQI